MQCTNTSQHGATSLTHLPIEFYHDAFIVKMKSIHRKITKNSKIQRRSRRNESSNKLHGTKESENVIRRYVVLYSFIHLVRQTVWSGCKYNPNDDPLCVFGSSHHRWCHTFFPRVVTSFIVMNFWLGAMHTPASTFFVRPPRAKRSRLIRNFQLFLLRIVRIEPCRLFEFQQPLMKRAGFELNRRLTRAIAITTVIFPVRRAYPELLACTHDCRPTLLVGNS